MCVLRETRRSRSGKKRKTVKRRDCKEQREGNCSWNVMHKEEYFF